MVVSLSASLVFRRAKKIDWPLILVLESATVVGGFLGGCYSAEFSGPVLRALFAFVVLAAGLLMLRFPLPQVRRGQVRSGRFVWRRQLGSQTYQVNLAIGLPASFLAGLISGMVGVGGGILKVPLLVLLLGVPLDIAIGSSALMIGLTAGAGFAGHLVNGHWDWRLSLILAVAVFAGGQIGSRISVRMNKRKLKLGFGYFMLLLAAVMLLSAFR